jgi:hypothetical protein
MAARVARARCVHALARRSDTPMVRTLARTTVLAMVCLAALSAQAQPRTPARRPPRRAADAGAPTAPPSSGAELISVPVADIDTMLRQMRVWLFNPPPGATGYGLSPRPDARGLWALLPSCRPRQADDPRDPCPIDRVVIEAVGDGGASVTNMDPLGVAPGAESRRVQSFVVPASVGRVRVRIMGLNNAVRYEAVVNADRLVELPAPAGNATPGGFSFTLAQYPAR